MALKVGQLRRWTTLPEVFGRAHLANGLQFRVTDIARAKGEYTGSEAHAAGFVVAEPAFMEAHSTEEDDGVPDPSGKGGG